MVTTPVQTRHPAGASYPDKRSTYPPVFSPSPLRLASLALSLPLSPLSLTHTLTHTHTHRGSSNWLTICDDIDANPDRRAGDFESNEEDDEEEGWRFAVSGWGIWFIAYSFGCGVYGLRAAPGLIELADHLRRHRREPALGDECLGFRVWGLGFGVYGFGFSVEGLGFRVQGAEIGV